MQKSEKMQYAKYVTSTRWHEQHKKACISSCSRLQCVSSLVLLIRQHQDVCTDVSLEIEKRQEVA